jgi:hypothetical protein
MRIDLTGRRPAALAFTRTAMATCVLLAAGALSACTTVEGTNAMTDPSTFEREVMNPTLVGLGLLDQETKKVSENRRAPLVLPKSTASLPAPVTDTTAELLPEDSDTVQIDMTGLTEADLTRLRHARVIDLRSLTGRQMTEVEARQLAAQFQRANGAGGVKRPLFLPPDEYFTVVDGQEMVCLAANGDLVPLSDKSCPAAIRRALGPKSPTPEGETASSIGTL